MKTRTVVHISDLHFGAADERLVDALVNAIGDIAPDVVAISGDLTQRARRAQFAAARAFLLRLPAPTVVVPGNHDVPLYNVLARLIDPLGGYRRYISRERFPVFADDALVVAGADTTRSLTIQDGGLRPRDVRHLVGVLTSAPPNAARIIVCHHPFDPLIARRARLTAPRPAADAMARLVAAGADVFLTGHLHVGYVGHTAMRYGIDGRSAIVVEAGTATSVRLRGEINSFNVLRIDADAVQIERRAWSETAGRFVPEQDDLFTRTPAGWSRVEDLLDGDTPAGAHPTTHAEPVDQVVTQHDRTGGHGQGNP